MDHWFNRSFDYTDKHQEFTDLWKLILISGRIDVIYTALQPGSIINAITHANNYCYYCKIKKSF